jgi:hypothetical protein
VASALDELNTRISEIRADHMFVALAAQLRPRIGDVVQWQAEGEVLDIVKKFMQAKSTRPEGMYGPLLIRLLASFERYLRMLVSQTIESRTSGLKTFEELPEGLSNRNMIFTGRILAAVGSPRDHLTMNVESLVSNLATCRKGAEVFRLNALAFSATVMGVSPETVQKALEILDVDGCWDGVGGYNALAKNLGTKGTRATGERAKERLKELWRWRNHLAHGGDEEIALSESQLRDATDFIVCLALR